MSSIEITKAPISEYRKTSNPALSFVSIVTVALLSACGGGSGGSGGSSDDLSLAAALPDSIIGTWQSACFVVSDGLSARNQLDIDTTAFNRSTLLFANSNECAGQLNYLLDITGLYTQSGDSTQTGSGVAQHIDIDITDIEGNSTPSLNAQLALEGSSIGGFLQETIGISDTDNIQPEEIGLAATTFSLIMVENDVLRIGDNNSNTGDSPETRLTELSAESQVIFTRQ